MNSNFSHQQRTRIKVCGFTRAQDIDAAVQAGIDAVGFVLYPPSPRAVSIDQARELARRLPSFVTPVLLFVNESIDTIQRAAQAVPGALLQFHGDESPEECQKAALLCSRSYLKAARIPVSDAQGFDLVKFANSFNQAQAILLDTLVDGYGGGGKTFNWSHLPPNVSSHLVLSGGLTPANVTDGIAQVRSRGLSLAVDVSSGVELDGPGNKGLKDAHKIHQFVQAVRAADERIA
jgi:phosphoribosylanthranilate isomerase